jgi:hypothetical protein
MDIIDVNFESDATTKERKTMDLIKYAKIHLEIIQETYDQDVDMNVKITDLQSTMIFLLSHVINP